jgi:hypothetical protein
LSKIIGIVGKSWGPKKGYIVVYTTATKKSTIEIRFRKWKEIDDGIKLIKAVPKYGRDVKEHWGYALLRVYGKN